MNQTEFESIVPTLRHRVIAVARGYGLDSDDAEDVAQDAMLKLWNIRDQLGDDRPINRMAVCVARHLSIDHLRRRRTVSLGNITPEGRAETQPDTLLETEEDRQWLAQQMDRLPSTEHTVLHLRQVEQRTTEEIAAIVGISPASVVPLLSRARRHLLEQLKQRNKT